MRICLAAASVAFIAACGTRGTQDAGVLASRYLDAIGGREAVSSLATIHTLDSLYMAGLAGTSEAWWEKDPFRGRIVVSVGPVSQEMLVVGDSVWSVDRNGVLTSGDALTRAQAALAAATVFYGAFLEAEGLLAEPDTVLDTGERVSRLVLTAGGIDPVTYYLSVESGLPVMMKATVMGMEVYSRPGDWEEVSGIMSPRATAERIPALGQETSSVNILTEYNVPIPEGIFMAAGAEADWILEQPGVPFLFVLDGQHIYLNGTVCGVEAEFLLDTGAGATVIDTGLAADLGLEASGSFSALGVGGSSSFGFVAVPEYSVAGAVLSDQSLAAMALDDQFYPLTGHHIGVVLGYDFLSRFVTEIDYGERTITLREPGSFEYLGPGSILPASRTMGLLSVEAVLEDSMPVVLLLDTGAGGGLHLSASFLENHPSFLDGREVTTSIVQGVGGEQATQVFRAGGLEIGGYVVPAGLCSTGGDVPVLSEFDGIAGSEILSRFVIYLDYQGESVVLEPSSLYEQGLPEDLTGLGLRIEGDRLSVAQVVGGSPADSAGFLEGDIILSVDGHDPGGSLPGIDSLFMRPEGSRVAVEVERDGGREVLQLILRRTL